MTSWSKGYGGQYKAMKLLQKEYGKEFVIPTPRNFPFDFLIFKKLDNGTYLSHLVEVKETRTGKIVFNKGQKSRIKKYCDALHVDCHLWIWRPRKGFEKKSAYIYLR